MLVPILAIGGLFLLAGAGKKKKGHRPQPVPIDEQILNYCVAQGGQLSEMEGTDGLFYTVCQFPDGRAVVAEDFFRGEAAPECPAELWWDPDAAACVEAPVVGVCESIPPTEEAPYGWMADPMGSGECVPVIPPDIGGDCSIIQATPEAPYGWVQDPTDPEGCIPAQPPTDAEAEMYAMCLASVGQAWIDDGLDPVVVANLLPVMASAATQMGAPDPAFLAEIGMGYVAPDCDWIWMTDYIERTQPQGPPQWLAMLYLQVFMIAEDVIMGMSEPDIMPGPVPAPQPGPYPAPLPIPNGGGGGGQIGVEKCPPNYFYDALHDVCCPDGFYFNVEEQMCRPMGYGGAKMPFPGPQPPGPYPGSQPIPNRCPPNLVWDANTGRCVPRSRRRPPGRRAAALAGRKFRYPGNGIKWVPKKKSGFLGFMGACGSGGCGAKWVPNRGQRMGNTKGRGMADQRAAYAGFGARVGSIPQTR